MSFVMKQDQSWLAVGDIVDIVRQVCHKLPSPVSRKLSKALKLHDWSTVSSLSIDPRNYRSPTQFAKDYQLVSWLKKAEFLELRAWFVEGSRCLTSTRGASR